MRQVFKAVHGDTLREGKGCVSKLTSEFQLVVQDLPTDIISFFAKISIFFRMSYLNRMIKNEKHNASGPKLKKLKKIIC